MFFYLLCVTFPLFAQNTKTIVLNPPNMTRGLPVMKALSLRASANEYDTTRISLQDLSDLLWASNGINRPDVGKRTAPSAINAQDIDVYVCMASGTYLYDAKKHALDLMIIGDYRKLVAGRQENVAKAPVICLLVSDISRFKFGADSIKLVWAADTRKNNTDLSQTLNTFLFFVHRLVLPRDLVRRWIS